MSFNKLAYDRYSVRRFSDRKVEREKLDSILEAALAAPTAVNRQPFRIWVIESPEALEKARESTHFHFHAPVILVVGADPSAAWERPYDNRNFADVDAAIAATHMMLAIHDLGLGTTWVGHFDPACLKTPFPDMAPYDLIAMFPVGYPAQDCVPHPLHETRKPAGEIAVFL